MAGRKLVNTRVSHELFLQVYGFPEGTQIVYARMEQSDFNSGSITLTLTHPELPSLPEGVSPPMARPEFYKDAKGVIRLKDWGIE